MKSKLPQFSFVLVVALLTLTYFYFQNENELTEQQIISDLRKQHEFFLANSPFKKTLQLSKSERKAQGIPANKYYEREWELTMNPATGFPEPNKVLALQTERNSIKKRAPGDGDVTNNWVERGPNNVGGRTRVILFDPNDADKNRVFAGGVSGGLWVNEDITNANSSWTLVDGVPGNMNISCITVDPNNSQVWYIGTGEQYTYGAAVGNGVYKTTNGGNNWVNVPVQLAGGGDISSVTSSFLAGIYYINDIIAWNNGGSTQVFIGVGGHQYGDAENLNNYLGLQSAGLYKTIDNGLNWSRIESANMEFTWSSKAFYFIPNDFEISVDNKLYMGTITSPGIGGAGGGKVFSSSDGSSWTLIKTLANSNRVEIAVSKTNATKMYALTEGTTSAGPHIYATTDAFLNVIELAKPTDADTDIPANDFTKGQDWYNLMIEVDPIDDKIFYVGGIDLFRSDQGTTTDLVSEWKQISKWSNNNNMAALTCSVVHADQHAFAFRPGNSNEAVIGNDGGVYYASNLATANNNPVISARNKDYNVTQFYKGGYGQSISNELILAGAQDNGTQFINGASQGVNASTAVYGGDGAYSVIDKDGDYMIASYIQSEHYYFKLPYTGDYEYIIDETSSEGDFINQAGLDHHLNIMYSNGTGKINRYILGPNSKTKSQLTNALLTENPTAFKVSPYTTSSTTLLVGTDKSKLLKLTNANNNVVGSIAWTNITGINFIGSVSDIEFGTSENEIYVTMHNYGVISVWYTANGGTTWTNKEGNLPDMPVKCILPNPLVANEVIIGTELGIWSTKNFNDVSPTWVSSYNGMRDVKVVDLDLRTADNSILATTFGRGVFTGKFLAAEFTISTQNEIVTTCTSTANFNFNLNTYPSYNTNTEFSTTGEPAGVIISFTPTSLKGVGSFSMTVNNVNSLAVGEYPIRVIGTGLGTNFIDVILKVVNPTIIGDVVTTTPLNAAVNLTVEGIIFNWNSVAEATSYDIEISTDAGFSNIIETKNVSTNEYTLASTLNSGTVYYWRVRAVNNCVTGNFSESKKFQTQHNCNIYSNNISVPIPDGIGPGDDGTPATSVINIPTSILVNDVNVTVNISHTYLEDLRISLISQNNTEILLYAYNCVEEDDINVIFDDAGLTINCESVIQETVKPLNPLAGFNAQNAQGNWTLKVVDNWGGDFGTIENWAIEICENKTVTNSSLTNNPITVGTNSFYVVKQTDIEATSLGSTDNQQVFMLTELPAVGTLKLNNVALLLGQTFTQADINNALLTYENTSFVTAADSFKVDITNATGGFLPNQEINITIDSSLNLRDDFLAKAGISIYPTISNGYFSIASTKAIGKTNIELYAMTGQRVFIEQLDFSFGNVTRISANQLAPGVYILKLNAENIQGTKKIVIK